MLLRGSQPNRLCGSQPNYVVLDLCGFNLPPACPGLPQQRGGHCRFLLLHGGVVGGVVRLF